MPHKEASSTMPLKRHVDTEDRLMIFFLIKKRLYINRSTQTAYLLVLATMRFRIAVFYCPVSNVSP